MTTLIAAITRDGALGRDGDMIYHIGADLRRFKQLTMGHPIVMGRRTFESFPNGALPGRRNLVITRNAHHIEERELDATGTSVEVYPSLEAALAAAGEDEAMVLGGGMVYSQAMPLADRLLITEIEAEAPDADTFFPVIDPSEWEAVEISETYTDPRSGVDFRHIEYRKL